MENLSEIIEHLDTAERNHVVNVAANLQLVADLGYSHVALLVPVGSGELALFADARPMTAVATEAARSAAGNIVDRADEPEAYDAIATGGPACSVQRRKRRGIAFTSTAYPIGPSEKPYAVAVRHLAQSVAEAPGTMEVVFMRLAARVLERLCDGPLTDLDTDLPYATTRTAGDGILEVEEGGAVVYASPNALVILRLAGLEGTPIGGSASTLPGGAIAIAPVLGTDGARSTTVEVGGRTLDYRSIGLDPGALVLVEDITEARRREQELRVKEATIREVHHRVKNNLQTIASLLRIQARRSATPEAADALEEAVERVSSMAIVHEMLAESTADSVDLSAVVRTVVQMVRRGLAGDESSIVVRVEGETGLIPAQTATSLALVVAELVHNAIEHGTGSLGPGEVTVTMRRTPTTLQLEVSDSGPGFPSEFGVDTSAHLGLAIVKTVVEDDLRGTLEFNIGPGSFVLVTVPVSDDKG